MSLLPSRRSVIAAPLFLPFSRLALAAPKEDVCDTSTHLLIDISGSVDAAEYKMMMKGLGSALSKCLYDKRQIGLSHKLTTLFFGSNAILGDSAFVTNPKQARDYIVKAIYDDNKDEPRPRPNDGTYTNIVAALRKSAELYAGETESGLTALKKTVIVLGDGPQSSGRDSVADEVDRLATQFGAAVHGVPIIDRSIGPFTTSPERLIPYYRQNIATKEGAVWKSNDQTVPVARGQIFPAEGFEAVGPAVELALNLNNW